MKSAWQTFFALLATVSFATTGWSQGGQGGAGGTGTAGSGGAAALGSAGAATSGGAGVAGTAGAAGTAGTAGAAGTAGRAGTAGTAGSAGAPGTAGAGGVRGGVGATGAARRANINQSNLNRSATTADNPAVSQTPFFSDPGARRQLNLNDNQFNTLNRAYQDAYNTYNRGVNNLNDSLTPQQRQQRLEMLGNQFNSTFNRSLGRTIADPAVRARYDQLYRQSLGFNAFNQPALQNQLNLTPQQQVQIRQLAQQWREQLRGYRNGRNYNISPDQWSTMYNQYWNQLNGVLTPQQQQSWQQLTGQRYAFPPSTYLNEGRNPATTAPGAAGNAAISGGANGTVPLGNNPTTSGGSTAPGGTSTATGTSQGTTTR